MSLRVSVTDRVLDLPPPFGLVTLRESGDAFARAFEAAGEMGAGTLLWTRRFDVAEFAVVLEPEEKLGAARRAHYAGMNALVDALAVHAPPNMPITFDWPDAVRVDGVLVGGGRLGWPEGVAEDEVPPWLVFGAMVRTAVIRAGDPGLRPLLGGLDEVGFQEIDPGEILASFARFLKAGLHDWEEGGFGVVEKRFIGRMAPDQASSPGTGEQASGRLDGNGDILIEDGQGPATRRSLREALAAPSWRDPKTGMPWL